MSVAPFIHLRLHSEFSIADSIVRLEDAIAYAAKEGMPALALTDLNNGFGWIRFYREACRQGIQPLLGVDAWVNSANGTHRMLLLVQNQRGYLNLCHLISRAWLENQRYGQAQIEAAWLTEINEAGSDYADGLLALSGAMAGEIGQLLLNGNATGAKQAAQHWSELFPQRFYIELQRADHARTEYYISQAVALAAELRLPIVATHPIQFMSADEFVAHEARVCIAEGELLANPTRTRHFTTAQYFKTPAEMVQLFADLPSAVANTLEIAKRCHLQLTLGQAKLPLFPTPAGMNLDEYLTYQAQQGLAQRLQTLRIELNEERARYQARLQFEIETIIKMGFSGYFLIVADFINWSKQNNVPVGPGRGSGAGSLVAYALGITDLDPLKYNLLFERFLNPERVSMPDFDIDFCQQGRDRVIHYVKEKYGKDAVSQIATFGTMAARAAIRDVGRVLDLGYNYVDGIAKLIPFRPGKLITIAEAKKEEPLLLEREQKEEEVRQLLELAQRLEGITRNVGMHAGGVLIAPGKLTDFCPLYIQDDQDAGVVSQYDKDDVEAAGLVKFDFLGLTTLTILDWSERYTHLLQACAPEWHYSDIPLDDAEVFKLLRQANTVAVFQLESRGMQNMLRDAKPDRFEDIIAMVALYRPGPMDLIPSFIARKHGREPIDYPDARVEPILRETYGIMVYQEQVMQMAQIMGAYSLGNADLLRRAMGKKKPEEMAQHRHLFREGASKNGLSQQQADEIFDLMEKFAGYGFNKSHAAAYALLSYYTAWFKTHHPAAFMAANLSLAMDDTDKVKVLYEDSLSNGLTVVPPDINTSEYRFVPMDAQTIRYGLGAIKGTGEAAIADIMRARQEKPFTDLFDFCQRIDRRVVNRRAIEALIRAGAFDRLTSHRAQLLKSVTRALEVAEQLAENIQQIGLFDATGDKSDSGAWHLVDEIAWSMRRTLQEEKQALGFYLSGHLFDEYRDEVKQFSKQTLAQITEGRERVLVGVIVGIRTQMSQRGKMLIVLLDDSTAQLEVTIYNELYETQRHLFKEDELIIVKGQVRQDHFSGGLRVIAEHVMDMATARAQFARGLKLSFTSGASLDALRQFMTNSEVNTEKITSAKIPIYAQVIVDGAVCELASKKKCAAMLTDTALQTLRGAGYQIEILY